MTATKPRTATISLPWPPSTNAIWGNRVVMQRGRKPFVQTYVKQEGQRFRQNVQAAVWSTWGRIRPIDFPLRMEIIAHPPDKRKRDIDNLLKATLDALDHAGVYADDSLIRDLRIRRGSVDKPAGRLEVTIEELDADRLF